MRYNNLIGVRLKSGCETLLLNGEGYVGVASSALLCYQKNKTTKLSLAVILIVIEDSSRLSFRVMCIRV
jgi:hypothetical protein